MTTLSLLRLSNTLLLVVTAFLFASCSNQIVVQDSKSIPLHGWEKNDKIALTIPMADTVNAYELYVTLRVRENYPYNNLYLFVTSYAPSGAFVTDTLQYDLFNDGGEPTGKWSSGIGDYRLPFMRQASFLKEGEYRFEIAHGMRMDVLPGVLDVGICVERPD